MAPRANWKGYLKLSLVSCEIALYPATAASERVRFNRLNRQTGNRLKQLLVDAGTEEPVEREDQVKGYQVCEELVCPGRGRGARRYKDREHAYH